MINKCINDFDNTQMIYLNDIKNNKSLTKSEERKLFRKYKKGDLSARNKLIESNLKFVVKMANEFRGRGVSYSDLISEGNAGLIKALDKYNPKYNVKLFSYGVWWIRQSMQDAIYRNGKNSYDNIDEINLDVFDMEADLGENQDSLDPIKTHKSIQDYIDEPSEKLANNALISKLIKQLKDREKNIIEDYFGLKTGDEMTLDEIGQKYGLTKERVRQIKEKTLTKMRSTYLIEE